MAVDLTTIRIRLAEPILQEFGGLLTPALGGPVQRVERAGSRWAVRFETPMVKVEPEGREWAAMIARAKRVGGLMTVPQPGLVTNMTTAVVNGAFASGRIISIAGVPAGAQMRAGQWLSIVKNGQRYLDQVAVASTASAGGVIAVSLQNLLRVPLIGGELVEIGVPKIEGWIDEPFSFPIDVSHITSFVFTITEAA